MHQSERDAPGRPALRLRGASVLLATVLCLSGLWPAQADTRHHTIYLTALEVKGGTSQDRLAPPATDPTDLSEGYRYRGPGTADPEQPGRWEVASYLFHPAHVTLTAGDTVELVAFIVNGDEHEVELIAPDGTRLDEARWERGREYRFTFTLDEPGVYTLLCVTHEPTMVTHFRALPRP